MSGYAVLLHTHAGLAVLSGVWYGLRGAWRLGLGRPIGHRLLRAGPHVVDTLLLSSGVALMIWSGLWRFPGSWFGLKLVLVVVYVGLGIAAFRTRVPVRAWLYFGLALATWVWILGMAIAKSGLGWAAGWAA